jgi:hypothetical protein
MQFKFLIPIVLAFSSLHAHIPSPYYNVTKMFPFTDEGWFNSNLIDKLLAETNAKVVIELGAWLGKSTRHFAQALPKNGVVYTVDHWFCPPYDQLVPIWYWSSDTTNLYNRFLSNIIHAQLTHKIIPLRMSTMEAAQIFYDKGIKPDLIFIDAEHDEYSVYNELTAYFPLVKGHGLICGSSWGWGASWGWTDKNLPVQTAVTRFAEENNLKIEVDDTGNWNLREQ